MFRACGPSQVSRSKRASFTYVSCSETHVFRNQTGPCNAPVTAQTLQRSWTLQLLLLRSQNAPGSLQLLLIAATAASWPLQRSCNAPGRCNAPDPAPATLLYCSWTLQRSSDPAPATLLPRSWSLPRSWPIQDPCNVPATVRSCYQTT